MCEFTHIALIMFSSVTETTATLVMDKPIRYNVCAIPDSVSIVHIIDMNEKASAILSCAVSADISVVVVSSRKCVRITSSECLCSIMFTTDIEHTLYKQRLSVSDMQESMFNITFCRPDLFESSVINDYICLFRKFWPGGNFVHVSHSDISEGTFNKLRCRKMAFNSCTLNGPQSFITESLAFTRCEFATDFTLTGSIVQERLSFRGGVGSIGATIGGKVKRFSILEYTGDTLPYFVFEGPTIIRIETNSRDFDLTSLLYSNARMFQLRCETVAQGITDRFTAELEVTETAEDGIIPHSGRYILSLDQIRAAYLEGFDARAYLRNNRARSWTARRVTTIDAAQSVHTGHIEKSCQAFIDKLISDSRGVRFDHMSFLNSLNISRATLGIMERNMRDQAYVSSLCAVCWRMSRENAEVQREWFVRFTQEINNGNGMCARGNMNRLVFSMFGIVPEIVMKRNINTEIADFFTHNVRKLERTNTPPEKYYPILRDVLLENGYNTVLIHDYLDVFLDDYVETGGSRHVIQ